jgi:hypothetical protein
MDWLPKSHTKLRMNMRESFIPLVKKNPALATGIILPVMLVVLFSFAALLPKIFVNAPRYDLLFSMKTYSLQGEYEYKFSVDDGGKLQWRVRLLPRSNGRGGYDYRLYRYDAESRKVHEVKLPDPKRAGHGWSSKALEEANSWRIDPSLQAPDGYHLYSDYKRTSDLGLLFFSGTQRSAIHVVKDSRIISIYPPKAYRSVNTPEFIGWVVAKEQAS